MTRDVLQDMLRRHPFEPIKMTLVSGETKIIAHPELSALSRTKMLLVSPDCDSPLVVELNDIVFAQPQRVVGTDS